MSKIGSEVVVATLVGNPHGASGYPSGGGGSLAEKLASLQEAKEQGLLSETEHAEAKNAVIASLTGGVEVVRTQPQAPSSTSAADLCAASLAASAWSGGKDCGGSEAYSANPWQFNADRTFVTLRDGRNGNWSVRDDSSAPGGATLRMDWRGGQGGNWAEFKLQTPGASPEFRGAGSSYGLMRSWNVRKRGEGHSSGQGGLAALRARNQDPNSGCAQFRVGDTHCADHLDSNGYWLRKDGLSRGAVPPPLVGHCTPEQWGQLIDDIERATNNIRCNLCCWCLLGGMVCSPLALCYCYGRKGCLEKEYRRAVQDFEFQTSNRVKVSISSFMSYWDPMPSPPKSTFMLPEEREKDRGVVIFQLNV